MVGWYAGGEFTLSEAKGWYEFAELKVYSE